MESYKCIICDYLQTLSNITEKIIKGYLLLVYMMLKPLKIIPCWYILFVFQKFQRGVYRSSAGYFSLSWQYSFLIELVTIDHSLAKCTRGCYFQFQHHVQQVSLKQVSLSIFFATPCDNIGGMVVCEYIAIICNFKGSLVVLVSTPPAPILTPC